MWCCETEAMASGQPKFLYFDLGNVLLTFDHRTACEQVGALVGRDANTIWDIIFESQLQARYEQGELDSRQFYEAFCHRLSSDGSGWPEYDAFHQANSDIFRLHLPVMALVGHLKSAGYPMGILSNTCAAHWEHVARRFLAIGHCFSVVVRSDEQHCSKPHRTIFEVAARLAQAAPRDIFFVDDRAENVEGARAVGFDAVLFQEPRQLAAELRARGLRFNY